MTTVRDMLGRFGLDRADVLLAMEAWREPARLPWCGELFNLFSFCVIWFASAVLALASGSIGASANWTCLALGLAAQLGALLAWRWRPAIWTLAAATAAMAAGSAAMLSAILFFCGSLWPFALATAGFSVALAASRLSFSLALAYAELAILAAFGACRDLALPTPYLLGGASLLACAGAAVMMLRPVRRFDFTPHAFAAQAFGLGLWLATYIIAGFESLIMDRPVELAARGAGALACAGFAAVLAMSLRRSGDRWRLAAAVAALTLAACGLSAGVVLSLACVLLGIAAASRGMMVMGSVAVGAFSLMAFVDVADWIMRSHVLWDVYETALLLLGRW
ncbi:hypothetical protein FACS1894186_6400 [Alphaproteobacteria bacterium]|nr:hypothetical protein FACS1894186_6400 [Alphaproteobacteria bacterium]